MMTWIIIFRHIFVMMGAFGILTSLYEYFTAKHITKEFAKAQKSDFKFSVIVFTIGLIATICI